jgi:predicted peptidase
MEKKTLLTAVAIAAFGFNVGFGSMAHAEFRPATQEALETHTGVKAAPGQDSSEDKLPASQRFVSTEGKIPYQLCLPRWYDSAKTYPLIVVVNDVAGETDEKALLKQPDGVTAWADELENNQQYVIVLTIQGTKNSEASVGRLSSTKGMDTIRDILKDVRQNYGVNKDAIYGIGENKGAWVIQLINEELPSYFKATYLDENRADGQVNNQAIHDWLMNQLS